MKFFLLSLLACSLGGALAIGLILLIKKLLKDRLSPSWHCYVWLLVMILFVVPAPIKLSLPDLPPIHQEVVENTEAAPIQQIQSQNSSVHTENMTARPVVPQEEEMQILIPLENTEKEKSVFHFSFPQWGWQVLFLLWLGGTGIFFGKKIKAYRYFVSKLKMHSCDADEETIALLRRVELELLPKKEPLKLSVVALPITPMIVGFVHPTLYLPKDTLNEEQLRLVFTHELCHYQYGDLLYKMAAMVLQGIHWFNPLCHLMVEDIDFSCELCCDRRVGKHLGENCGKEYSFLILDLLRMDSIRNNLCAAFSMDQASLKRRLSLIMKPKKTSRLLAVSLSVLLTFSGVACSAAVAPEVEAEKPKVEIPASEANDTVKLATIPRESAAAAELERTVISTTVEQFVNETSGSKTMLFPLPEGTEYKVTKAFNLEEPGHLGLDITAAAGTELRAPIDGQVIVAGYRDGSGNTVRLWSKQLRHTVTYAHCEELLVQAGDTVTAGQVIATLGSTGLSTGPNLHIEICKDKADIDYNVDPARFFAELEEYIYVSVSDKEHAHVWEEVYNMPYLSKDLTLARVTAAVRVLEATKDSNAITVLKEYITPMESTQKERLVDNWFETRYIAQALLTDSSAAILEQSGYGAADLSGYTVEDLSKLDDKVCSALENVGAEIAYKLSARKLCYDYNDQYCTVEASTPPLDTPCVSCGKTVYYFESFISDFVHSYRKCVNGAEDHDDQIRDIETTREYICLDCGKIHVVNTVEEVAVHLDGIPEWRQNN